ncbi:hypothetical protein JYU19_00420 [bacterium AH-315-J21]|nr:hypothetical protein [bacterium AH-315-J21]
MKSSRAIQLSMVGGFLTVALIILPLFHETGRLWGGDSVKYLPGMWKYVYILAWVIIVPLGFISVNRKTLSLPFLHAGQQMVEKHLTAFVVAIGIVSMGIFYLLRSEVHFLGDGYSLLSLFSSENALYMQFMKSTEVGSTYVIRGLLWLRGSYSESASETAFQFLSVLSGGIIFWNIAVLAKTLFTSLFERVLFTLALWLTPIVLLFFGYVEFYPFLWVFLTMFIVVSVRSLKNGSSVIPALLLLGFASFLHLSATSFGLGAAYLLFLRVSETYSPKVRRIIYWTALVLSGAVTIAVIYFISISFWASSAVLLPLFEGRQEDVNYSIFSLKHVYDILNLAILMLPALLIVLPLAFVVRNPFKNRVNLFLLLCGIGGAIFLFTIDPRLGMARDWDLMSFTLLPFNILLLKLALTFSYESGRRLALTIVFVNVLGTVGYVWSNTNAVSAEQRFRDLLNMDSEKSRSGWYLWRSYHRSLGEYEIGDLGLKKMHRLFPAYAMANNAYALIERKQLDSAHILLEKVMMIDSMTTEANLLSAVYWGNVGEREKAEKYFTKVYQLQPETLYYYILKFKFYADNRNDSAAIDVAREGLQLYPEHLELNRKLGVFLALTGRLESAEEQANLLERIAPTYHGAYQIYTMIAVEKGDETSAKKRLRRFFQFCDGCNEYERMKSRFGYLLTSE